jgi:colanic acid biosynthesis glycosyl transferase WcaI
VIPPASDDSVRYDEQGREEFRTLHKLSGKFVVMHAGNHSPCHSLDPLLESASQLQERADIVFCFVGGGSELGRVRDYARAQRLENIYCLPYQPQEKLAGLLSAADLHVVVMGEAFRGIVHPSKIYNILATGLPFLYLGPNESHMGDIIARIGNNGVAMHAHKGDVPAVVRQILSSANRVRSDAAPERNILAREFSQSMLQPKLIAEIESAVSDQLPFVAEYDKLKLIGQ